MWGSVQGVCRDGRELSQGRLHEAQRPLPPSWPTRPRPHLVLEPQTCQAASGPRALVFADVFLAWTGVPSDFHAAGPSLPGSRPPHPPASRMDASREQRFSAVTLSDCTQQVLSKYLLGEEDICHDLGFLFPQLNSAIKTC